MLLDCVILFATILQLVTSYSNKQFTIMKPDISNDFECDAELNKPSQSFQEKVENLEAYKLQWFDLRNYTFPTIKTSVSIEKDPLIEFETIIHQALYGRNSGTPKLIKENQKLLNGYVDTMAHSPTGQVMQASIFNNKSGVHLPFAEYIHREHAYLNITRDYMQTAVDAFAIFLAGSIEDIMKLPPTYVLESARTIAMMRIAREKLVATWQVVKGSTPTNQISYQTLEKYKPLFKYVNGKEISRLNLMDEKILSYIGSHPDLNRHQVGLVASRYLNLNKNWTQARYLNLMNNLLCGVPLIRLRQIPKNTFLQLSHQLFHHIQACDPLQRKFYMQMMTRTQALGKSYSWTARDVFRLGLLLAELDGPSLSTINPEAMAGITSKVMLKMPAKSLQYVTEMQTRYIEPKALNIMAKKLLPYQKQNLINNGCKLSVCTLWCLLIYTENEFFYKVM